MKVVEVIRPNEIIISEKPNYDKPEKDEVIVKMKSAGICGSDLHIYTGNSAFAVYPNIMGHELAGEIYEIGNEVEDLNEGDRVSINNVLSCGHCYACSVGKPNVCKDVKVIGVHVDGGFQEYFKTSRKNVFKLPESIPWEHAALIEPYSIAAQVIDQGRLVQGDHVLICGVGPLGLITLQAVKRLGDNVKVTVMDIVESRLEIAKELGADYLIHAGHEDVKERVMAFTHGEGASLIIESTGSIEVLELCVSDLASQAGRIVVLGFPKQFAKISPYDIMRRELEIIGSRLNNYKFPQVIEWFENGEVDPSQIISHRFQFEDAKKAMDLIQEKPSEVIKVVLDF